MTQYRYVVSALNIATMKYGTMLVSPYEIFHGRKPLIGAEREGLDKETAFRSRMRKSKFILDTLTNMKQLDAPEQILDQDYSIMLKEGTKVMILREYAKKNPIALNYKILPRYEQAIVVKTEGQRIIVQTLEINDKGEQRMVQRRFVRAYNQ